MSILLKLKSVATALGGPSFRQTMIDDAIVIEAEANRVALKVDPQHNADGTHKDVTASSVTAPSMTLGGVQRNTWPAPGSATVAIDDVLANGHVSTRDVTLGNYLIGAVNASLPALTLVDHCFHLERDDSPRARGWRRRKGQSWRSEPRSLGRPLGSYATATAAVTAGAALTDFYWNTTNSRYEEITNVGTPTSTATYRAGKEDYPTNAIILASATTLFVMDLDGAVPSMWAATVLYNTISSVVAKNNTVIFGRVGGFYRYDFMSGVWITYNTSGGLIYAPSTFSAGGSSLTYTDTSKALVHATVNSLAITVLPDAPMNEHEMPIPTIAVATGGGVSVYKHDGTVVNDTTTTGSSVVATHVGFTKNSRLMRDWNNALRLGIYNLTNGIPAASFANMTYYDLYATVAAGGVAPILPDSNGYVGVVSQKGIVSYGGSGFSVLMQNEADRSKSMFCTVTSTYNTGWMTGDIRRAIGYDNVSVLADKSVKASAGVVAVGALAITPVAGGRTAVSGFTNANYIQEPSHADINAIGAGNFLFVIPGAKLGTAATLKTILSLGNGASAGSLEIEHLAANTLRLSIWNATPTKTAICTSTATFTDTAEHTLAIGRGTINGVADTCFIAMDGVIVASAVSTLTISNATGYLRIGEGQAASQPWVGGQFSGYIRFGATASTVEGLKFIAATENAINGGHACLLSNSSAVSQPDYYRRSNMLAVPNGTNTDFFVDLAREGVATTSTGAIVSGMIPSEFIFFHTGTTNTLRGAERNVSAELLESQAIPQIPVFKQISSDGSGVLTFPQGLKPIGVDSTAGTYVSLATNAPVFDGYLWLISGLTASTNYDCNLVRG